MPSLPILPLEPRLPDQTYPQLLEYGSSVPSYLDVGSTVPEDVLGSRRGSIPDIKRLHDHRSSDEGLRGDSDFVLMGGTLPGKNFG